MWNETLTDLNYKLAELYPSGDAALQIATMAGLPVAQISFNTRPLGFWFSLLQIADQREKLRDVLRLVIREQGELPILIKVLDELDQPSSVRTSSESANPRLDFSDVQNLIASGRTKDALILLVRKLEQGDKDLHFRAVQLQGQFSTLSKDQMLGVLSHGDAGVRNAQIVRGALELIREVEEQ